MGHLLAEFVGVTGLSPRNLKYMRSFAHACPSFEEIGQHAVAHLSKVRRGEGFMFSWEHTRETGSGHSTIWIHPAITLLRQSRAAPEPGLD